MAGIPDFNVESSTGGGYRAFIENLRVRLKDRFSHNRPVLALQVEDRERIQFFDFVIRTNNHSVRFRLRMDNLYLIGYMMENGQWFEFGYQNRSVRLIQEPRTAFLGFDGSYTELVRAAQRSMDQITVGFRSLVNGINELATSEDRQIKARYLIVVIMMICESTRLVPISDYMATSFHNEGQIETWMTDLVTSWGTLSEALLRADAYPEQPFELGNCVRLPPLRENRLRLPPVDRVITNIHEAAAILGILLRVRLPCRGEPRRLPRMTSDEGQCVSALPLVEVFSVRIDNIDGEDPGQLFGTITVNDGLNTEYIYDRTRSDSEDIKPGENASLKGPSQSMLAIWKFTIKLLLTDRDFFWDDVIVNEDISWDAFEIGNVYDKPIFQKLHGKNGSVTVNYAVLRDAVAARITVTLEEGGESTANVYGQVNAHYDNWEDPNTTCLLFNRSSGDCVDVRRWQKIPLLRSIVAVPLNGSLIVKASLYDYDYLSGNDKIADGYVKFPAQMSGISSRQIRGEDGNWVMVRVDWSSEI